MFLSRGERRSFREEKLATQGSRKAAPPQRHIGADRPVRKTPRELFNDAQFNSF